MMSLANCLALATPPVVATAHAAYLATRPTVYIHAFRSPSTGLELRSGAWGVHGGLYTTILNSGGKSTEFLKTGVTYYFASPLGKRFEVYNTVAYMRGLNRDYRRDSAIFVDQGLVYTLGRGFSARLGSGLLLSNGHRPKTNPTVGISYQLPL